MQQIVKKMHKASPKAIHICNSHEPTLKPKIAKEYVLPTRAETVRNKAHTPNKVSYVIGQQVVNWNISTLNKHTSGLKVKCFEMPNATYTNRYL